ncbi:MAG: hypothetical protein AAB091_03915 [Elusimicrobiota bacterium]
MRKSVLTLYLETSLWGFLANDLVAEHPPTLELMKTMEDGNLTGCVSEVVIRELGQASEPLRTSLLALVAKYKPRLLNLTQEAAVLAKAYQARGVIPLNKTEDALHAAVASVYGVDVLVSWNYRHLVNVRKNELINAVNLEMGYRKGLRIATPPEVIESGTE